MVQTRFFHALFTGLKHNMRLELKKVLKSGEAYEELLHEISVTVSIELEHLNKFRKQKLL